MPHRDPPIRLPQTALLDPKHVLCVVSGHGGGPDDITLFPRRPLMYPRSIGVLNS
jgi:hypothetical protein